MGGSVEPAKVKRVAVYYHPDGCRCVATRAVRCFFMTSLVQDDPELGEMKLIQSEDKKANSLKESNSMKDKDEQAKKKAKKKEKDDKAGKDEQDEKDEKKEKDDKAGKDEKDEKDEKDKDQKDEKDEKDKDEKDEKDKDEFAHALAKAQGPARVVPPIDELICKADVVAYKLECPSPSVSHSETVLLQEAPTDESSDGAPTDATQPTNDNKV